MNLTDLFDRTVFLLGAGASMDAGCSSSKQMLTGLRAAILEIDVGNPNRQHFLEIYDFVMQSLIYQHALKNPEAKVCDISNVEDFISVLRQVLDREYIVPPPLIGNWNSKITTWELRNATVFVEFLNFAYDCLINRWTRFDPESAVSLLGPFKSLIETDEDFGVNIFTLNYDLIFETVFNREDETLVNTGLSQGRWTGNFDDEHHPSKLKLYKLHGSMDWHFDQSEEEVRQQDPSEGKPLIVFGSGPKMQSYDPFLSLLGKFASTLKAADLYVVIGYSFQDKYINNILIQNLNAELNKKMIIVDPCAPENKQTFIERIEGFQRSKSLNELINLTMISPDRIEIVRKKAKAYYQEVLADRAEGLKETLRGVERGDQVF